MYLSVADLFRDFGQLRLNLGDVQQLTFKFVRDSQTRARKRAVFEKRDDAATRRPHPLPIRGLERISQFAHDGVVTAQRVMHDGARKRTCLVVVLGAILIAEVADACDPLLDSFVFVCQMFVAWGSGESSLALLTLQGDASRARPGQALSGSLATSKLP